MDTKVDRHPVAGQLPLVISTCPLAGSFVVHDTTTDLAFMVPTLRAEILGAVTSGGNTTATVTDLEIEVTPAPLHVIVYVDVVVGVTVLEPDKGLGSIQASEAAQVENPVEAQVMVTVVPGATLVAEADIVKDVFFNVVNEGIPVTILVFPAASALIILKV